MLSRTLIRPASSVALSLGASLFGWQARCENVTQSSSGTASPPVVVNGGQSTINNGPVTNYNGASQTIYNGPVIRNLIIQNNYPTNRAPKAKSDKGREKLPGAREPSEKKAPSVLGQPRSQMPAIRVPARSKGSPEKTNAPNLLRSIVGAQIRLNNYADWDSSCHSSAVPTAKVVVPPAYGRISFVERDFPVLKTFFGDDCVGTHQHGITAYYVGRGFVPPHVTQDRVSIRVDFSSDKSRRFDYVVRFKEGRKSCLKGCEREY